MDTCGNNQKKFRLVKSSYWLYSGFTLLVLLASFHCRPNKTVTKNIILITLDTLRADHVSLYGTKCAKTPNIDFFAESGVYFQNFYSPIPITLPAHAAIFYSQPPHNLKVYNNGQLIPEKMPSPSLAYWLSQNGYETAAFVSLGVLKSHFKLNQGFDCYEDSFPQERWYLNAAEINERVLTWLNKPHRDPFFLWIHYSDPHDPYAPPVLSPDFRIYLNGKIHSELCLQKNEIINCAFELNPGENTIEFEALNKFPIPRDDFRISLNDFEPEENDFLKLMYEDLTFYRRANKQSVFIKQNGRIKIQNSGSNIKWKLRFQGNLNLFPEEMSEGYKNEVEYLDSQIGELTEYLEKSELLENSIVVLAGDHGEGLGEHYLDRGEIYFGHIHYLYTFHTRVPLIIYDASLRNKSKKIKQFCTLNDIAPTLLKMIDLPIPSNYYGNDLLNFNSSGESPEDVFFETYTPEAAADKFALLRNPWLLVFTPETSTYELYDLQNDPRQQENIYIRFQDNPLIQELIKEINHQARKILSTKTEIQFDQKSREILKSLGYIK